ncbi:DUF1311 domain-containing protein [Pantoea sp. Ap-967]|uniref:lysozyme inhibitor LprI family protein n=1 Tax=Pantoea sp. Ap-967 TaxID=2608362 RepID=UPI00141EDFFE|nr:DUF1311 domain-containing protein [Pantoea sp. Ap-967]
MKSLYKAICLGSWMAMGAAHADVGREEALDAAVRQFAAKLEGEWQQCLKSPNTHTTNDSEMCALAMLETASDAVTQKYQGRLVRTQQDAEQGVVPASVPALLPQAQAAWESYVKADCGVVGALVTGTASTTYQLVCQYKHQIQRLDALDRW